MNNLLVLNYNWLSMVKETLFEKLTQSEGYQNAFIENPTKTLSNEFPAKNIGEISKANVILHEVLNNIQFLEWYERFTEEKKVQLSSLQHLHFPQRVERTLELFDQKKIYSEILFGILQTSKSKEIINLKEKLNSSEADYNRTEEAPTPQVGTGGPQSPLIEIQETTALFSVAVVVAVAAAAIVAAVYIAFSVDVAHPGPGVFQPGTAIILPGGGVIGGFDRGDLKNIIHFMTKI